MTRMITHQVRVYPSTTPLPKTEQLAWKIAEVANAAAFAASDVAEMVSGNSDSIYTSRESHIARRQSEGRSGSVACQSTRRLR